MTKDNSEILGRLIRIETRIAKLMTFLGVNPSTGEPLPTTKQRSNHGQPTPPERQRNADRR